jgi:hypothetical protein
MRFTLAPSWRIVKFHNYLLSFPFSLSRSCRSLTLASSQAWQRLMVRATAARPGSELTCRGICSRPASQSRRLARRSRTAASAAQRSHWFLDGRLIPKCSPEPIVVARVRKPLRNQHSRLPVEKEIRMPAFFFGKVGIHVEIVGFPLDHADHFVGRNRKPEAARVAPDEVCDNPLTLLVKLFRSEVETLDRASERIPKQRYFRLPVDFTPSAFRKARKAASTRSWSASVFTSGGWRFA